MSSPPPTAPTPSANSPLAVSSVPPPSSRFVLPPPSSDLMLRLSAFLPQIKQANEQLEQDPEATAGAEPVTLVPVKAPKEARKPKREAKPEAAGAASDSDASNSSSGSSEDESDESDGESSEGEEIVLVNMGEDALPEGVDRLRPIVAPAEDEAADDGEGLEAGKLGLNAVPAGGKPAIVEMEQ